jgi:uncharacterized protein (TIGR01244 family)
MSIHVFPGLATKAALFVCLTALAFAPACGGTKGDGLRADYPPLKSAEMGTMRNVCVSGPIWFGGMPTVEDLDLAKRRGIESVIGLCGEDQAAGSSLADRSSELGMDYLAVPVKPGLTTPAGTVDLVLGKLLASKDKPTLMYCESGGISAMFFAIYRVVYEDVEVEEALIEARRAGMKPGPPEEFVLTHIERLTGWSLLADSGESDSSGF